MQTEQRPGLICPCEVSEEKDSPGVAYDTVWLAAAWQHLLPQLLWKRKLHVLPPEDAAQLLSNAALEHLHHLIVRFELA